MKTYCVLDCPEYAPDENNGEEGAPGARYDDGYVRIAAIVLKKQISAYHTALEQYTRTGEKKHLRKVKSIERELRTTYYATLTMNSVDMDDFIVQCRKKHGVDAEV